MRNRNRNKEEIFRLTLAVKKLRQTIGDIAEEIDAVITMLDPMANIPPPKPEDL